MAGALISDRVAVTRRYVRSVDMARDVSDPAALDGYVVTPSARDGLTRILAGLRPGSTQRAFRVTGPYGSGKSSFGLLLARICSEQEADSPARRILLDATEEGEPPSYLPIILVGRRTSLADELLRAVAAAAASADGRDEAVASAATQLLSDREGGARDVRRVLDLATNYASSLARRTGRGVLLLIDEMGRYLEFAAANPALEDPSIFQLLAERAGGSSSPYLGVVGFLHHRFGDYVAGLGEWMEGEWARSSERYEEIAFQESTEQTLYLMAQALAPVGQHDLAVRKRSVELYRNAAERQLFASTGQTLEDAAARLYPLHPAALACLATSSRRFGQNERSVFSFLQSLEPAGFRRFALEHRYGPDSWYRPHHLFDYLAAQGSFRFRSPDRERRWQLALDAIALCADMAPFQLNVLKTLCILAVLEPVPGLKSDAATIAWCQGETEQEVRSALAALVERGVAHARSARGDYSLWSHTSVDLDRWFEDARLAVPAVLRLDEQLRALPPSRPLVAHRHYHQTGTLRTFSTVVGAGAVASPSQDDGQIIVLPIHPDEHSGKAEERARALSLDAGPLALVRTRPITAADLAQTHELACWRWVRANCRELRIDDVARSEVDKRIATLESELSRLVAPFSDPAQDAASERWCRLGHSVQIRSRADLSRLLSDMCDETYKDAPVLRNELINRDRISKVIAAARMRLLELMLTKPDEAYLGLDGAPPERTIYLSLFHASGVHRKSDEKFEFLPPSNDDPKGWRPTWVKIDALVRGGESRFDALIAELAKPPIGLRTGPALLIIAAYMLHNRSSVALMERNTFQPEITPSHFMRLAKSPSNFALRHVAVSDGPAVLEALADGLSIWAGVRPEPKLKPIVEALYKWWDRLPDFARTTRSIDRRAEAVRLVLRKAREPIELIFESLPEACGALRDGAIDPSAFVTSLDLALTGIGDAFPTLQKRAAGVLIEAFGTRSLGKLRQQIELDYQDHLLELGDRMLRTFVDRAINPELGDAAWLDGIASLIAGRRLEAWEDDTLDGFAFEVRSMAQRLARRLAQIRESKAQAAPVAAVHLLGPDGAERSMYLRVRESEAEPLVDDIRKLLANADDPDILLLQLLDERIAARHREKTH